MRNWWPWNIIPLRKEEFEELKEKAENWDEWLNSDIGEFTIDCSNKLEAVRKYLDTIIIPSVSDITNLKSLLGSREEK